MNEWSQNVKASSKKAVKTPSLLKTIYFAFLTSGMMSTLLGAVLPFMQTEYHMNYVLSGAVLSAHQIGNLLAVFIAGFLPYLIGRKKSTVFMGSGIALGLALMIMTGTPILLIAAFALTGIGRGTMSNISNVVVAEVSENKTAALNLLHAMFAVGAFTSPFLAILVTQGIHIGWRISVLTVVVLEVLVLFLIGRSSLSNVPVERKKEDGVDFAHSFSFWLNTAILFFYLCSESAIVGWLVTYFKDSGLMSTAWAQSTSSILWIMVMIGRLSCAAFSSRFNKRKLLIGMAIADIFFFVLMISTKNMAVIMISLMGVGLSMAGIYPTTFSTMDVRFNSSTEATGICISTATVGAILMPMIVGAVAERIGIAGGIAMISGALAIMLVLILVKFAVDRKRPSVQ